MPDLICAYLVRDGMIPGIEESQGQFQGEIFQAENGATAVRGRDCFEQREVAACVAEKLCADRIVLLQGQIRRLRTLQT